MGVPSSNVNPSKDVPTVTSVTYSGHCSFIGLEKCRAAVFPRLLLSYSLTRLAATVRRNRLLISERMAKKKISKAGFVQDSIPAEQTDRAATL
jgi:hypothetical protein